MRVDTQVSPKRDVVIVLPLAFVLENIMYLVHIGGYKLSKNAINVPSNSS